MQRFDEMQPELEKRGIRVIALSKDTVEQAAIHKERDGLTLTLLADPELDVIRKFGVEHHKALNLTTGKLAIGGIPLAFVPSFKTMAIPTTLLVDEDRIIRWIDQADDYRIRSDNSRVKAALAVLLAALLGITGCDDTVPTPTNTLLIDWSKNKSKRASVKKAAASEVNAYPLALSATKMDKPIKLHVELEAMKLELEEDGSKKDHVVPTKVAVRVADNGHWLLSGDCGDGPHYKLSDDNEVMLIDCIVKLERGGNKLLLPFRLFGDGSFESTEAELTKR